MRRRTISVITLILVLLFLASCTAGGKSHDPAKADEIDLSMLPDGAVEMLTWFEAWYYDADGGKEYDREDPQTCIIASIIGNAPCVDYSKYPIDRPEAHWGEIDPKRWAETSGLSYQRTKYEDAEWVAVNVFGISPRDYKNLVKAGEDQDLYYCEKDEDGCDWLYIVIGGVGDPFVRSVPVSVRKDSERYYVVVEQISDFPGQTGHTVLGRYYAEMELRDGYWSLYRHTQSIPECFGE